MTQNSSELLRQLIAEYLIHECHSDTYNAFVGISEQSAKEQDVAMRGASPIPKAHNTNTNKNVALQTLLLRKQLKLLLLNGETTKALKIATQEYPQLKDPLDSTWFEVAFRLSCLHFVELVRDSQQTQALLYARDVMSQFQQQRPSVQERLQDVVALLAYENPQQSPVASYLEQDYRVQVAELLNNAILASQKKTRLEQALQHVTAVMQQQHFPADSKTKKKQWTLNDFEPQALQDFLSEEH